MKLLPDGMVPLQSGAIYDPVKGEIHGTPCPWLDVALPLARQPVFGGQEPHPWSRSAHSLARCAVAQRLGFSPAHSLDMLHAAMGAALVTTSGARYLETAWHAAAWILGVPPLGDVSPDMPRADEALYHAVCLVLFGYDVKVSGMDREIDVAEAVVRSMLRSVPTVHEPCARLWWVTERELRAQVPGCSPLPVLAWETPSAQASTT